MSAGMAGNDPQALGMQLGPRRIVLAVEEPVGIVIQLVPASFLLSRGVKNAPGSPV